ncbi:MAG: HlyD family efflux transporter periplasmic adaptor subunit [Rhodospirillales bacterium]|nr:HlyD family efflux transporter periplasmic adaptor subunit [Rhodospirillales bacterium]
MPWRRVLIWGVAVTVLAVVLVVAMWPQPVQVDLAMAKRGPLTVTVDEEGITRVRDVFVLSAPIGGLALRIDHDVGDSVVAGRTVVAEIEPSDPYFLDVRTEAEAEAAVRVAEAGRALAAAELERAKAELAFAVTELERARKLIRRDTISQHGLDEAEREHRTAQAALEEAKAKLGMREFELERARAALLSPVETSRNRSSCECVPIHSPVDGQILRILHESEGVIQAGEPLVEIGDPRELEIVVDLLSPDAVKVQPGQRAAIEEWGGTGALAGRVRRVEPYGFTKVSALGIEEQRVNVIIDFADPPERWAPLGHGYRIEARIVTWEGSDVLKLPLGALFRDDGQWAVFVDDGGRARRRPVEVGHFTGLEVEILSGLDEGTPVVLYPSDRVVDNARIAPRP